MLHTSRTASCLLNPTFRMIPGAQNFGGLLFKFWKISAPKFLGKGAQGGKVILMRHGLGPFITAHS